MIPPTATASTILVLLLLLVSQNNCIATENVGGDDNYCPPDGTLDEDGVCKNPSSTSTSTTSRSSSSSSSGSKNTCTLWDINDGWMLSGTTILRNQVVPALLSDVMIPWKQHSSRSFPRWARHHYFFRNPKTTTTTTDATNEYIFAPAYKYPLECHKLHANLAVNYTDVFINALSPMEKNDVGVTLNPLIRTDRTIAIGDPIFLPCTDPTLSAYEDYTYFPKPGMIPEEVARDDESCINPYNIQIKEIESTQNAAPYYGTFTRYNIEKGSTITSGIFIYMHRSELHDPVTGMDELLLNYCYAPRYNKKYTSPLLLLPLVPGANGINHADTSKGQTPNVAITWMDPEFDPVKYFVKPTEILFGDAERSTDEPPLSIKYIALRNIIEGEELLLDYGTEWQDAYQERKLQNGKSVTEFRHPIGLPKDMIPPSWLEKETITQPTSYREWLIPTLNAGELQPIQLSVVPTPSDTTTIKIQPDTRQITGMVDRIGLPIGMSQFLMKWADEIGITEVLRSHVRKELALPTDGQRRLRLNGTTWWVKRFPSEWRSDMHYISPDDYESNQMFMSALADAGFDTILQSVGQRDNLTSITVYYPAFIAVSHCTTAFMHNDSEEDGHYNVIFPVLQVNNSQPELIVGDADQGLYAPYKYEPDHAVVLGNNGLHGTAPCDYRGTDSIRMVVSVYMLDGDNIPTRDKVLKDWLTADPPYPRIPDRLKFIETTKHWKRGDPSRNLRNPQAPQVTSTD